MVHIRHSLFSSANKHMCRTGRSDRAKDTQRKQKTNNNMRPGRSLNTTPPGLYSWSLGGVRCNCIYHYTTVVETKQRRVIKTKYSAYIEGQTNSLWRCILHVLSSGVAIRMMSIIITSAVLRRQCRFYKQLLCQAPSTLLLIIVRPALHVYM